MSREIKFRGIGITGKWVYGGISIKPHGAWVSDEELPFDDSCRVDPKTVGQYTSLKDKNGKEIYEGDIFPNHFNEKIIGVVQYGVYAGTNDDNHGGHVGFFINWKDNDMLRKDLSYWIKVSHVIGNIYENPDLV